MTMLSAGSLLICWRKGKVPDGGTSIRSSLVAARRAAFMVIIPVTIRSALTLRAISTMIWAVCQGKDEPERGS